MKLLIVDDEWTVCLGTRRRIVNMGFGEIEAAVCAYSGEEALERLREEHFDAMFTDIRMAEMDGLELVRQARALNPTLICVIITAYDQFQYAQRAIRLGVEDFLVKPVSMESMRKQVRVVIDKWLSTNARRENQLELEICAQMLSGERDLDACFSQCGMDPPERDAVVVRWERLPDGAKWEGFHGAWLLHPEGHHFLIAPWEGDETRRFIEDNARRMKSWFGVSQSGRRLKEMSQEAAEALGFCWRLESPGVVYWVPQARRGLFPNSQQIVEELRGLNIDATVQLLGEALSEGDPTASRAVHALLETLTGEIQDLQARAQLPVAAAPALAPGAGVKSALQWVRQELGRVRDASRSPDATQPVNFAMRYAQAHLYEPIDMAVIANELNMNYAYFSRVFRERTGETFSRYLLKLRMREVCRLLQSGEKLVEIAEKMGYQNAANLTRSFTREMGVSPSKWLEAHPGARPGQ